MSPRHADPAVRAALLATAARLLAAEGPAALTTRRLATEAGTSTMAVYTRFGSLQDVHRAVRADGYARLRADLLALPEGDDPVAGLVRAALGYLDFAVAEPHLYRAMTVDRPPPKERESDPDPGEPTFHLLVDHVRRCVDAGRFVGDPGLVPVWAAQLWSMQHGMATLALAGTVPPAQIRFVLEDMAARLCVGYGDDPEHARRSVATAVGRDDRTG